MKISASIQASNIYNLLDELENYKDSFDQLHVDITDGNFTNNISLPVAIIEYIKNNTDYVIDTHLMLNNNELFTQKAFEYGSDVVTVHCETTIPEIFKSLVNKFTYVGVGILPTTDMKTLSNLVIKKNASVLEAPITGGQHRAESGNISILVAGRKKTFQRAFPVLSCVGHQILHCGKIGNASTLKVVTNYLASIHLLAIGEALMVCKKYGLDLKTAYKGIKISSGNSFVHETESQVILNGSYDVGFTMDLVCKDVGLFDKLTKKFNIPAKISNLMLKICQNGQRKLGKRSLSTSIVKLLETDCDENLRSKGFPSALVDLNKKKKGIEV